MNHLLRGHAPITDAGWALLDDEARERLRSALAARKLVDFDGPKGWEHSATNLGRTTAVEETPTTAVYDTDEEQTLATLRELAHEV